MKLNGEDSGEIEGEKTRPPTLPVDSSPVKTPVVSDLQYCSPYIIHSSCLLVVSICKIL